jgi:hypothetical protein
MRGPDPRIHQEKTTASHVRMDHRVEPTAFRVNLSVVVLHEGGAPSNPGESFGEL